MTRQILHPIHKVCVVCGKEYVHCMRKNKYCSIKCRNQANADNQLARHYKVSPELIYKQYVKVSKNRGLDFELTIDQFFAIKKQPCTYCGTIGPGGIDRKDNRFGYTLSNSVPCCYACNMIKGIFTVEFMIQQCRKIVNFYKSRQLSLKYTKAITPFGEEKG